MTIQISARHVGCALFHARRTLKWDPADVAHVMGVSENMLRQYEYGAAVLDHNQLEQIFTMGLMMMRARRLQGQYCELAARLYNPKPQQPR